MTDEERIAIRKEFRKYLRTQEGIKATQLNAYMRAADDYLPELIREHFMPSFLSLYEEQLDLKSILLFAGKIEKDERMMAGPQGFACWTAITGYAKYFAQKNGLDINEYQRQVEIYLSELDENKDVEHIEGRLKETTFFRRKRNKSLREECIRRYGGYVCYVCGFNFEEVYGERGKEFIEVHHLNPMANYEDEHSITADELRPLCSNCHSMIHKDPNGGVTDIEVFKAEYKRRNPE